MMDKIGLKIADEQEAMLDEMADDLCERLEGAPAEDRDVVMFAATMYALSFGLIALFNELQDIKKQLAETEKKLSQKIAVWS